jgi:cytochrome c biogenesis protein CcdA
MTKPIIVREKSELEAAIKNGAEHIIVKGELAEKLEKARVIKKLSKPMLAALAVAIAAMPFTGGISGVVGVTAAAALTGIEIVAIVAVAFLGLSLVLMIAEKFHMKYKRKTADSETEMEMTKK